LPDLKLPQNIAHRGGREWAPENTMAAFKKCLDLKVDGLELDIHRCKSGELVVIHDDDLNRTTNGGGYVKDATLDELRRLSAGAWLNESFASERIPTMQEVLDFINGDCIINIEIKNTPMDYKGIDDDLIALLKKYKARDKIIVSSFDHAVLKSFHKKEPEIPVAVLAAARFVDLAEYATKIGATYFHPAFDCSTEEAIAEAHEAKLHVNAWTINAPRDWKTAMKWKIDGIVTDDPAGLKKFYAEVSKSLSMGSRS
jgi:glycerophosphoryl diester phosphodiesterase